MALPKARERRQHAWDRSVGGGDQGRRWADYVLLARSAKNTCVGEAAICALGKVRGLNEGEGCKNGVW
jgi:hypothetical protein